MVVGVKKPSKTKPAKKVVVETVPAEPVMEPYGDADRAVESMTIAHLKSQETESIRIPIGLTVSGVLSIIYNGVRMDLVEGSPLEVASGVASIIRKRIEGVPARDQGYLK